MSNTENKADQAALLAEIFMNPSQEVKTDRFVTETSAAGCTGHCSTGACKSLV